MNIKNIAFGIFCTSMLFSCTKEDMEVQKNTDLAWEVREDLVDDDIRTSLGYDPRYTYVVPNVSTINYSVVALGDLVFPVRENRIIKVEVLGETAKKDIKVTLEYDPSLYEDLNNTTYGGYILGDENLISIDQKQKTISAGETSVEFQLSGEFSDPKKMIIPYSVKVESEAEIKKIGKSPNQFVIVANISSFLDNNLIIKPLKGSAKFIESFNKLKTLPVISKQYEGYSLSLEDKIIFENSKNRKVVSFVVNFNGRPYECTRYVNIDESNFSFTLQENAGYYWHYFSTDLDNILDFINSNAPYKYEKIDNSTIKVISEKDPEMWFMMERQ